MAGDGIRVNNGVRRLLAAMIPLYHAAHRADNKEAKGEGATGLSSLLTPLY
jgi:hypothetical protein